MLITSSLDARKVEVEKSFSRFVNVPTVRYEHLIDGDDLICLASDFFVTELSDQMLVELHEKTLATYFNRKYTSRT